MHFKLSAFTVLALVFSGHLFAADPMSSEAVKELITNNTMNGKNLYKNKQFTNYFREDGSATKLTSKGKKWQGKWHVTENGQHCVDWQRDKGDQCGVIIDLGNDTYHKMDGDKPRVEFTITEGNANNL